MEVVASVIAGLNVACEAVAGSGKTTTVLHCAEAAPRVRFLLLTYNARLKLHTRQRARELGLGNLVGRCIDEPITSKKSMLKAPGSWNRRLRLKNEKPLSTFAFIFKLRRYKLEVHSFHAMAARYYAPNCRNDEVLWALVEDDRCPHSRVAFDCLVIDEVGEFLRTSTRPTLNIVLILHASVWA
jgi:hypothetical protein